MSDIDPRLFQENEALAPAESDRRYVDVGPLTCARGETLPQVTVAYETWGTLSPSRDNAILICHALSGDSHAIGWWDRVIGPGLAIDTDRFFVIGSNSLGGCQGTTGPGSLAPDGKPWGSRYPWVSLEDMVEVQHRLLTHLGIEQLLMVAGGSMGGMNALEWGRKNGARKVWVTASTAAHSAMQIGFNEAARQAVMRDPRWKGGDYAPGEGPDGGLAVARMLGHLSYLSEHSFERKFGRNQQPGHNDLFAVESYLNYQADKFVTRFDARSLVALTSAIDRYCCDSLLGSRAEYLFTSFTSDWLYPSHQSEAMHRMAEAAGCKSRFVEIDLSYGHDAFLLDGEYQAKEVRTLLEGP